MTDELDLDRSTRPGKWVRRGIQKEGAPPPVSPVRAVFRLCRDLREAVTFSERMKLLERYQAEVAAFESVFPESAPDFKAPPRKSQRVRKPNKANAPEPIRE